MGKQAFVDAAKEALGERVGLSQTLRELTGANGKFTKQLRHDAQTDTNLAKLGQLELGGAIGFSVHVTRTPIAPVDLQFKSVEAPESVFFASAKLSAMASVGAGASAATGQVGATAQAKSKIHWTLHERHDEHDDALGALVEVSQKAASHPFTKGFVRSLREGAVFQVSRKLSAEFALAATASYGLVRRIEGEALDDLEIGSLGSIEAGVSASGRVLASVFGDWNVTLERGKTATLRKVTLRKARQSLAGVELKVGAAVQLKDTDKFVEGLFHRALEWPDGLVSRLETLQQEVSDVVTELRASGEDASQSLAEPLSRLADNLESQAESLPPALASRVTSLVDRVEGLEGELVEFVDDRLERLELSLADTLGSLDGWLASYRELKERARKRATDTLKEGVEVRLGAALNRTATQRSVLQFEFDITQPDALSACVDTLRGHFAGAVELSSQPAASGVRLLAGSLKKMVQTTRIFNLRVSLFGFQMNRDFRSWTRLGEERELVDGSILLTSEAGAAVALKVGKRHLETSFVFDLVDGVSPEGGAPAFRLETGFQARFATQRRVPAKKAGKWIRRHVRAASSFELIEEATSAEIRDKLLAASGSYEFSMDLVFPPGSLPVAFGLGAGWSKEEAADALWESYRRAANLLDLNVRSRGKDVPLADLVGAHSFQQLAQPVHFQDFQPPPPREGQAPLDGGATLELWSFLSSAHRFVDAYAEARELLVAGGPATPAQRKALAKKLRLVATRTVSGAGTFETRIDPKYLALALMVGSSLVEARLSLNRGDFTIHL